jgi:hypothetical protein
MSLTITFQNSTSCTYEYSLQRFVNMYNYQEIFNDNKHIIYNFYTQVQKYDNSVFDDDNWSGSWNPKLEDGGSSSESISDNFSNEQSTSKKQYCGIPVPDTIYKIFINYFRKNPRLVDKYGQSIKNTYGDKNYQVQKLDKSIIKNNLSSIKSINIQTQAIYNNYPINLLFDIESDYFTFENLELTHSCGILNKLFNATRYDNILPKNKIATNLKLNYIPFGTDCVYYFHYFDNIILGEYSYNSVVNTLHIADINLDYIKSNIKFWYDPYDNYGYPYDSLIPIKIMNLHTMIKNLIKKNIDEGL